MSQLYYTENGRVISTLNEEVTRYRRARKVLRLPGTAQPATLYVLARPYAGSALPLRLAVNGHEPAPLLPGANGAFLWYAVAMPPEWLRAGANTFEFWCDAPAMTGWGLGLEGGHAQPDSHVSDDGGHTWRSEKMGYLNSTRAEYMVRVRLADGHDPAPPAMAWEEQGHPRQASLRQLMPAAALDTTTPRLGRVQALSTWLSQSWPHTHSGQATQYAPWDAETILTWGAKQVGHDGRRPITMCVHYGVTLVTACQALGIPARCAIFTSEINKFDGHFAAEVWLEEFSKWAFVDANADALFVREGVPLSVSEIQAAGDLDRLVQWGPGAAYQRGAPHMETFVTDNFLKGRFIRRRSLWPRADFLSHPELSPPGHGATAYAETDLVWEARDRDQGFGMFPYFGDAEYFNAAPA